MNAVWIHLRRLVASIMLVAVASFVLHGGAMAGLHQHGRGSAECATPASGVPVHQAALPGHEEPAAHIHGHGEAHTAPVDDHADLAGDSATNDPQAAAGDTCCASVCAVALTAFAPNATPASVSSAAALLPASQDGVSTPLDGLKRPPRTSSTA